jgi:uncharacterized FlgJ-related protein
MNTHHDWNAFASDLESYIENRLKNGDFIARWSNASPEIEKILFNVNHLLADEDIRKSSAEYRLMQEKEARKLIKHLRLHSNMEDILKIGFLQKSDLP